MPPVPTAGGGGGGAGGEPVWDWGNLLDFAVHEDDSLVLPWDGSIGIEADPTEATLPPAPPPQPAEETEAPEPAPLPSMQPEGSKRRVRKRDPRLVCPNYLAGRVPCACPEIDEMAAALEVEDVATELLAGSRKKTKTAGRGSGAAAGGSGGGTSRGTPAEMRCQVPGCEADIRELKGYHRRHRVCLRCAHAAAVMLDGVQKRYCQQCGKFHILLDFDEDKRSCRRKLERHNKRRRRKPDSKGILEKDADDQLDLSADGSGDGELREENIDATTSEMLETVLSNKVLDRETPVGSEDVLSSPTCAQPSLQIDQSKSLVTFAASIEACLGAKQENTKLTNSPVHDTKSTYASSCPTGRVSFKLYDWNPAEFPRRLRHQIFEWLSSMPVELEGYIRPGCTILTVYVAMPQHMWDKLSEDTVNLVKSLVNAPNSLLLGKGAFFIHVNNMIFQVLKDGATLTSTRLEVQSPRIHYVHPSWFEAGKPIDLILCGSSLDQPKFRSLVSFDGLYLKHDCCRILSHETFDYVEGGETVLDSQHEIFRINITPSKLDNHGPAFVEVENVFGLSNFVPILVGSKHLCSELERIHDALCGSLDKSSDPCELRGLRQTAMSGFLIDIGWLIRKPSPDEFQNLLSLANIQRWICMMKFLIQNDFINVLEIIVNSLDNIIGSEVLSNLEKGRLENHVTEFLGYVSEARNIVDNRPKYDKQTQNDTRWASDNAPNPPMLGTSVPLAEVGTGSSGEHDLRSTNVASGEEENMPLMPKSLPHRQCCHPDINARWLSPASIGILPGGAMRMRLVTTVVITAVLCFTACVVLFHPHRVGVLAAPVKRYISRNYSS
uniref:SBP-type domain-containing protein n=1 Tax=Oryza brachyantha TaxID=4533 RepID=J3M734_ORYBR